MKSRPETNAAKGHNTTVGFPQTREGSRGSGQRVHCNTPQNITPVCSVGQLAGSTAHSAHIRLHRKASFRRTTGLYSTNA